MKKTIAIYLMTIIIVYFTLGDFILMQVGIISPKHRGEYYMLALFPMVFSMVNWIQFQFMRQGLRHWYSPWTYIGIPVAVLGSIPLRFIISRIDVGLTSYLPEIIIISICAKVVIWGFWLRLISGDNLQRYMNQQKEGL